MFRKMLFAIALLTSTSVFAATKAVAALDAGLTTHVHQYVRELWHRIRPYSPSLDVARNKIIRHLRRSYDDLATEPRLVRVRFSQVLEVAHSTCSLLEQAEIADADERAAFRKRERYAHDSKEVMQSGGRGLTVIDGSGKQVPLTRHDWEAERKERLEKVQARMRETAEREELRRRGFLGTQL